MQQLDRSKLIFAGAASLFLGSAAASIAAQAPPLPPPAAHGAYKNLRVFPQEIPRDRLIGVMRSYTVALGVKCTHCHVGEEGKRETMDFASDAKQAKLTTRLMMAMTRRLNEQDFGAKDFTQSKVDCFTCHRGAVKPLLAPPPVVPPVAT